MGSNQPAIPATVEVRIDTELAGLHPAHIARFEAMRRPVRFTPIGSVAGEYVYIVAAHQGRVLYYSDIDDGWGIDIPDATGGIPNHTELCRLAQIMNRLFGMPNIRTCGRGH